MIVTRAEWGSKVTPRHSMPLPAREVWLHHSVTAVSNDAAADVRAIERIGIKRFGHISYSYLFHPDGTILEGAGLQVGAHTAGRNSSSFGLCLIGDYQVEAPSECQVEGVRRVIARLIETGSLRPGTYPTGGHRDLKATACPGDRAYALLPAFREPWEDEEDNVLTEPVDALQDPQGGIWVLSAEGAVRPYRGARHLGEPKGQDYWGNRIASHLEPNDRGGYDVLSTNGQRYSYPVGG